MLNIRARVVQDVCIHAHMYVYVCICMYMYTHTHTQRHRHARAHTHTHTQTHTHTHTESHSVAHRKFYVHTRRSGVASPTLDGAGLLEFSSGCRFPTPDSPRS